MRISQGPSFKGLERSNVQPLSQKQEKEHDKNVNHFNNSVDNDILKYGKSEKREMDSHQTLIFVDYYRRLSLF